MSKLLTKEEVLHVADLARIEIDENEVETFQHELSKLLEDVEKINNVEGYDEERLIAPWSEDTTLRKDEIGKMLNPKDVVNNAPRHAGNYIAVPVVISENESEGA